MLESVIVHFLPQLAVIVAIATCKDIAYFNTQETGFVDIHRAIVQSNRTLVGFTRLYLSTALLALVFLPRFRRGLAGELIALVK